MVGKDVGRRAQDREHAQQQNQDRKHDERVGALQRNFDDPHTSTLLLRCVRSHMS